MCSFIINELHVGRVIFAVRSPDMGGFTRWDILNDKNAKYLSKLGVKFPEVIDGFIEEKASVSFIKFERKLLGLPWKS
jgi:tRNA(adenine34) deaminase